MAKIEPFEMYAGAYDDWFDKNAFVYHAEVRALRRHLPESKMGIEIGVGSGRFAAPLGVTYGVEPAKKMAMIAKRRGVKVIAGVAESLPFRDSCFDYAMMVTTICFLDDVTASFQEANRVLRKGGRFIIGLIDKESSLGKNYQRRRRESLFYNIATFYSVDEIVFHLNRAGFIERRFTQTVFRSLSAIDAAEQVKIGYGQGAFVAIGAEKQ